MQDKLYHGLGIIDSNPIADCLLPNDIFEVTIGWGAIDNQAFLLEAVFELQNENQQTIQIERFPLNEKAWRKGTSTWGNYLFRLNAQLTPGTYDLRLGVAKPNQQPDRWQPIESFFVRSKDNHGCDSTENHFIPSGAVFGEQIRLISYKPTQNESGVILDLAWQADQRIDQEYTVFLHLFDPATGIPVAQNDSPPRRNSLPTRFWWPGEVITDTITIPLQDIPEGDFGLALGIYLPESGERLKLINSSGRSVEDNRLILESTITIE